MALTKEDGTTYWNGRKMIWFEGGSMHIDAGVWADSRGISDREAEAEIAEMTKELLPDTPISKVSG